MTAHLKILLEKCYKLEEELGDVSTSAARKGTKKAEGQALAAKMLAKNRKAA